MAATFLAVQAQADDATVINLAGRQRMLTQKMTWLALTQPDNPDLGASIQLFDQTLRALQDGGPTFDSTGRIVTLPSPPDAALRRQLAEVAQTWTTLRAHLQTVDAEALQVEAPSILDQLDAVVSGLATRAQAKLFRLQLIQLISFAAGLLILAWGHYITQRHIVQPIEILRMAAHRIAQGRLADPIPPMSEDELGELGSSIETMRAEIATTRDALESRVAQRTHELALAFEFSQEIVAQLD
ncbi:MAG: type IV pili methyl-accepting chemotaxis transducer N-terminal domain-containing protein, partial [Chloroflexi bacterium]|nr:type IV pili methyl-accepting chemotaxis transducer N-terminal domain-containing protein [Chloroflexota bacterium]